MFTLYVAQQCQASQNTGAIQQTTFNTTIVPHDLVITSPAPWFIPSDLDTAPSDFALVPTPHITGNTDTLQLPVTGDTGALQLHVTRNTDLDTAPSDFARAPTLHITGNTDTLQLPVTGDTGALQLHVTGNTDTMHHAGDPGQGHHFLISNAAITMPTLNGMSS